MFVSTKEFQDLCERQKSILTLVTEIKNKADEICKSLVIKNPVILDKPIAENDKIKKQESEAEIFGKKVKLARNIRGITQVELANLIGLKTSASISKLERGVYPMSNILRISLIRELKLK